MMSCPVIKGIDECSKFDNSVIKGMYEAREGDANESECNSKEYF